MNILSAQTIYKIAKIEELFILLNKKDWFITILLTTIKIFKDWQKCIKYDRKCFFISVNFYVILPLIATKRIKINSWSIVIMFKYVINMW